MVSSHSQVSTFLKQKKYSALRYILQGSKYYTSCFYKINAVNFCMYALASNFEILKYSFHFYTYIEMKTLDSAGLSHALCSNFTAYVTPKMAG